MTASRRLLPRGARDPMLLFAVMLVIAIGNTGMQSVLPAIGRSLKLPDPLIAIAFSLSALVYAVAAPLWARRLARFGAKRMVLIGLGGFTVSLVLCGVALTLGLHGIVPAGLAFGAFVVGRSIYGTFGAAAPPAAQAMVVATTPRGEWTKALSMLASAFGLGTIVGPALAPFFVFAFVGLAGPSYAFALMGVGMIAVIAWQLPAIEPGSALHGAAAAEPLIGGEPSDASAIAVTAPHTGIAVRFTDPRVRPWLLFGLVAGHAQAIAGQTLAFLLIDRLAEPPAIAQPLIGLVLMAGALAALLAQWGVIPRLDMHPRVMLLWGSALAAAGCAGVALAGDLHGITVAFAIASLGFGFLRPGFTAGASLAVEEGEQGAIAGLVTAVNGYVFVLGPSAGVLMYDGWHALPYLVSAAAMAAMIPYGLARLREA